MSTATHERTGWQQIWAADGLQVYGSERVGWHVLLANGFEVAHYMRPGLDALGALALYRTQCVEAQRMKTLE